MIDAQRIAAVMGGKPILGRTVRTLGELDAIVSKGLPKQALKRVVQHVMRSPSDERTVLYHYVPRATLDRVRVLSRLHSERTERLARLVALAERVWDDEDDAREWLTTPHPALEGQKPIEAAVTDLGARRAELILMKGAYGLPV